MKTLIDVGEALIRVIEMPHFENTPGFSAYKATGKKRFNMLIVSPSSVNDGAFCPAVDIHLALSPEQAEAIVKALTQPKEEVK